MALLSLALLWSGFHMTTAAPTAAPGRLGQAMSEHMDIGGLRGPFGVPSLDPVWGPFGVPFGAHLGPNHPTITHRITSMVQDAYGHAYSVYLYGLGPWCKALVAPK